MDEQKVIERAEEILMRKGRTGIRSQQVRAAISAICQAINSEQTERKIEEYEGRAGELNAANQGGGVSCDFNSLRKKIALSYNDLADSMDMVVQSEFLERKMSALRDLLLTLMCLYEPDNPDCQPVDVDLKVYAGE